MKYSFVDIHTHVNFEAFSADREAVIKRAEEIGVAMINVGTEKNTSLEAVALSEQYPHLFSAVGIHPTHTSASHEDKDELKAGESDVFSKGEEFDYDFYKKLTLHPKTVAIGECGLDFFRMDESASSKMQYEVFDKHIALAKEVKKPLMLHIRNAYREAYEVLKNHKDVTGNLHFFAGSWEEAQLFLNLGYTLSFTGAITFARNYDEVIKNTPLERMMSETDAPYVSPIPYRGKRNEPSYVVEVVKKIAEIRGESFERVKEVLLSNTERVFAVRLV